MTESAPRTLVVSDLDGTLLRSDGTLGARTADAVNAFVATGGWFTYATARSFTSSARATRALDLVLPVITYGGAVSVDPRTGQAGNFTMLAEDTVRELLAVTGRSYDVEPIVFALCDGRDRVCWRIGHVTTGVERFVSRRMDDPRLWPLSDWSSIDLADVFFVSLIGRRDQLLEIRELLPRRGVHVVFSEDIYTADDWWLEISSDAATKAHAVNALRRDLGAERVVCFGDNQNDLPMFDIADWSVAVGNAINDVRKAAHEIVGSNDAEGVAQWLMARSG